MIDSIDKPVQLAASFDLTLFNHAPVIDIETPPSVPQAELPRQEPTEPDVLAEVEVIDALAIVRLCNLAGYPELAEACIRDKMRPAQVKQKLQDCENIKSLCAAAQAPDLAEGFIQAGNTVEEVRVSLFKRLTAKDPKISNTLTPDQQQKTIKPLIDTSGIYRQRNLAHSD